MPFNFSGQSHSVVAKLGVVSDGETISIGTGGTGVTSNLSSYSAFQSNPTRLGGSGMTGVWQMQLKDSAVKVCDVNVQTVLLTPEAYATTPLRAALLPTTTTTVGQLLINWVFINSITGLAEDLPAGGPSAFRIYCVYSETKV